MAFNVQDDTGTIEDANAYIAVAFLTSWLTDIGITTSYTDAQKQTAIVQATRYIDSVYEFAGNKVNDEDDDFEQTTEFPRESYNDDAGIELWLQRATAEYAKYILENGAETLWGNVAVDESNIKRLKEKVDKLEIDTEYLGGSGSQNYASVPIADNLIRKSGWLISGSGGIITRA